MLEDEALVVEFNLNAGIHTLVTCVLYEFPECTIAESAIFILKMPFEEGFDLIALTFIRHAMLFNFLIVVLIVCHICGFSVIKQIENPGQRASRSRVI